LESKVEEGCSGFWMVDVEVRLLTESERSEELLLKEARRMSGTPQSFGLATTRHQTTLEMKKSSE